MEDMSERRVEEYNELNMDVGVEDERNNEGQGNELDV